MMGCFEPVRANSQAGIKGGLPTGGGLPAVTLISDNDFLKSGFW
jgi:hypothetical protein